MSDVVEQVKQANKIEDVIGELFPMGRKTGRYLRAREHDSLVVDTKKQTYAWNSKGEQGDVIGWVMERNGWDFKSAVEWLCRRGNLPDPRWSREETEQRKATREREDVWAMALGVMQRLLWDSEEALGYCRGRGWTDETIREAGVGFAEPAAAAVEEMRGEFAMHEVDVERPDAVAILGYRGDVRAWGAKWGVEVQDNWKEWGMVPGLMGKKRLVYAHFVGGRVRTFSARNILGDEINSEGREVKSYNLPVALGGDRQVYFNHEYGSRADECVVVEGQADAITFGQWGMAAVALAGTSWQDHAKLLEELRKRHKRVYVGLDGDEAGWQALVGRNADWPLGSLLGPMTRVVFNWEVAN